MIIWSRGKKLLLVGKKKSMRGLLSLPFSRSPHLFSPISSFSPSLAPPLSSSLPPPPSQFYSTKPNFKGKKKGGKGRRLFSFPPSPPTAPPSMISTPDGFEPYLDPYHHLHDSSLPQVRKFINAQNRHAVKWFEKEKELVNTLVDEITSAQKTNNEIAIFTKNGNYWYFFRFDENDNLPTLYRCAQKSVKTGIIEASEAFYDELREVEGEWEKVLRVSEEGGEGGFVGVDLMKMSLDGRYLGYLRDLGGSEDYSLLFRNVETGENYGEEIPSVRGYAWASSSPSSGKPTVFYAKTDDSGRPHKVFYHVLGDSAKNDEVIFTENDPARYVSLYTTRDSKYVIITSNSKTSSEVRAVSMGEGGEREVMVWERKEEGEFYVEHRNGFFYIVTNLGGEGEGEVNDYCVKRASVLDPLVWEDVPLPNKEILDPLQDMTVFQKCLVLFRRNSFGEKKVEIVHFKEGGDGWGHEVEDVVTLDFDPLSENELLDREYDTNEIDFLSVSGVGEEQLYRYFLKEKKLELIHRTKSANFPSEIYETIRTFSPLKENESVSDGDTGVPITIIRRKDAGHEPAPLLLHVYGAYGESLTPRFEDGYASLLSRGWSLGYAHVRGGGEKGKKWHEEGKGLKKENSITDLISSAEFLISSGFTTPNQLALTGFSAGGLTASAALNRTGTSLFRVALIGFPFVDIVTTLMDETLPLSVQEYEEWGNPRDDQVYRTLNRYDPYRNIGEERDDYPSIFVRGSMVDQRVLFWQPLKYSTKLQQVGKEAKRRRREGGRGGKRGGDVILMMDEESGHHGDGGRFSSVVQQAYDMAFLLKGVGK